MRGEQHGNDTPITLELPAAWRNLLTLGIAPLLDRVRSCRHDPASGDDCPLCRFRKLLRTLG